GGAAGRGTAADGLLSRRDHGGLRVGQAERPLPAGAGRRDTAEPVPAGALPEALPSGLRRAGGTGAPGGGGRPAGLGGAVRGARQRLPADQPRAADARPLEGRLAAADRAL